MNNRYLLPLLSSIGIIWAISPTHAQTLAPSTRIPTPDRTLGTQVSGDNNNFTITGGLNRGQNLFHSFQDFSVPTGGSATFINPAGNRSIITRVTGNLFSDIDGLVNTQGANFFLINPNGIVFGGNARLDVGQTFVGTTAQGIDLVDGGGNSYRFGTNGNDAPLLTINPNALLAPARLIMGRGNGQITNLGTLQTTNPSQYIGLIGGDVNLNGGKIIAPGGRVDLGGLNSAGTVTANDKGLVFSGDNLIRGDVSLTNGAVVSVRANETLDKISPLFGNASSLGSSINVNANNVNILNSGAKSNTGLAAIDAGLETNSGVKTASGGDININGTGKITVDNADIKNTIRPGAAGKTGDINIDADSLDIRNQSIVSSLTAGKGDAGNINIKTIGDISISGTNDLSLLSSNDLSSMSRILSNSEGQGNAGKITIDTKGKLSLSNRSLIFSSSSATGVGNGGDIKINANELELSNYSNIESSTLQSTGFAGKGNAGNIDIKTTGNLNIVGTNNPTDLQGTNNTGLSNINSSTYGQGDAGKITIDTKGKLSIANRGGIFSTIAATAVGNSQGIKINANELNLNNRSSIGSNTSQSTQVSGKGNAGDIDIKTTGNLNIVGTNNPTDLQGTSNTGLSTINSSTYGQGDAGKITIDTKGKLSIVNRGGIFSTIAATAVGNSGGIKIDAKELNLNNRSNIESSTAQSNQVAGKGNAGDIDIRTTGDLTITGTNNPRNTQTTTSDDAAAVSSIDSSTYGWGDTGQITIDTKGKLSITNNGAIFSTVWKDARGNSKGIKIDTGTLDITNSSAIQTATFQSTAMNDRGNAGSIQIKAAGDITVSGTNNFINFSNTELPPLSGISSSTLGRGNAASITIDSKGKLLVSNQGQVASAVGENAIGNGGEINITANSLELVNHSNILTQVTKSSSQGKAGNINIKTSGDLIIIGATNPTFLQEIPDTGLSVISSSTYGKGDTGKITIDTKGKLYLSNQGGILNSVGTQAVGNSQGIKIGAKELEMGNRSTIQTATFQSSAVNGTGKAGDIEIRTTGNFSIVGTMNSSKLPYTALSSVNSSTNGQGDAGKITIHTKGKLSIANRGGIFSTISPTSTGNSGGIKIDVDTLELKDGRISTDTSQPERRLEGKGKAGDINIKVKNVLKLDKSDISSNSFGKGEAGNILIFSRQVLLNTAGIFSNSTSLDGGNITLGIDELLPMRNNSGVTTISGSIQTQSKGGNINISVPFIVTSPNENSDIVANAFNGSGGKVTINTQQNFWISPLSRSELSQRVGTSNPNRLNPELLNTNDITAISQGSPSLDGQVSIAPPGIDITAGLNPLPNTTVDLTNQINPNCSPKALANNSFTSVGRGGLPDSPLKPLQQEPIVSNWVKLNPQDTQPSTSVANLPTKPQPLVEAQGWRRERNGDIVLFAGTSSGTVFPQPTSGCSDR